jgi:hypothetical protein
MMPQSTAHDRSQAWAEAGVFLRLWQAGVAWFDELRGIARDWLAMDGVLTKAPLGGNQSLSPSAGSLGQETRKLSGLPASFVWAPRISGSRMFRIAREE